MQRRSRIDWNKIIVPSREIHWHQPHHHWKYRIQFIRGVNTPCVMYMYMCISHPTIRVASFRSPQPKHKLIKRKINYDSFRTHQYQSKSDLLLHLLHLHGEAGVSCDGARLMWSLTVPLPPPKKNFSESVFAPDAIDFFALYVWKMPLPVAVEYAPMCNIQLSTIPMTIRQSVHFTLIVMWLNLSLFLLLLLLL